MKKKSGYLLHAEGGEAGARAGVRVVLDLRRRRRHRRAAQAPEVRRQEARRPARPRPDLQRIRRFEGMSFPGVSCPCGELSKSKLAQIVRE